MRYDVGSNFTSSGVYGLTLSAFDGLAVFAGGEALGTRVYNLASMHVAEGGLADKTTVFSGGKQIVQSGGFASKTTVSSGGALMVPSGGVALNVSQYEGGHVSATISGGDHKTKITGMNAYGPFVLSSAVAQNFILYSGYDGHQRVSSGGVAINTTVSGGRQSLYPWAVASGTKIYSGGWQFVSTGASAVGTTVFSSGLQCVEYGGSAVGTTASCGQYA